MMGKKIWGGLLVILGYMLSPLSWWNDLFFNLPIACGFAYVMSWILPGSFGLWAIAGYWLSNVLGFVLMQWGATDMVWTEKPRSLPRDFWISLGSSTLYTVMILVLLHSHAIEVPSALANLN